MLRMNVCLMIIGLILFIITLLIEISLKLANQDSLARMFTDNTNDVILTLITLIICFVLCFWGAKIYNNRN